jgi:hypothetical protein
VLKRFLISAQSRYGACRAAIGFSEDLSNMVDGRMIVFAPHPDGETSACGGAIIRKIEKAPMST